ncbi:MAG: TfoX/Sxy family protein [Clostridia bacterium]|nr:TfoX/Sxy family protein [Clostridia bacterium]
MATEKQFVQTLIDGLFEVRIRPMMGEYVLYCREKVVGGIYDNRLLIKPVPKAQEIMPNARYELPYVGAKPMLRVENYDKAFLQELLFAVADGLPAPKKKR